jgi:hypothetical protein
VYDGLIIDFATTEHALDRIFGDESGRMSSDDDLEMMGMYSLLDEAKKIFFCLGVMMSLWFVDNEESLLEVMTKK